LIGAAYKMHNKSQRPGVYKCKGCEEQFTVTVGTVFERSHIPLNKWLFAFQMMSASKISRVPCPPDGLFAFGGGFPAQRASAGFLGA
jgi:hypothetical protein